MLCRSAGRVKIYWNHSRIREKSPTQPLLKYATILDKTECRGLPLWQQPLDHFEQLAGLEWLDKIFGAAHT